MDRYLIETPHTAAECLTLLKEINAQGYLRHFDWGCGSRVHTGWAIIEAENEAQAMLAVPPLVRRSARAVRINKYDSADLAAFEEEEENKKGKAE
jgi:hypothetical protein